MKSMQNNYRVIINDRVKFDNLTDKQIQRFLIEYAKAKFEIQQLFVDKRSNLTGYMTVRKAI